MHTWADIGKLLAGSVVAWKIGKIPRRRSRRSAKNGDFRLEMGWLRDPDLLSLHVSHTFFGATAHRVSALPNDEKSINHLNKNQPELLQK